MKRVLQVCDVGRRQYGPVLALQERLVEQRKKGRGSDILILVEHEPVYTLGRTAKENHILAPQDELTRRGIEVVRTSRGGDVTYHGPGQLVGYPILALGERSKQIAWYVGNLEETLIRTLADFGIEAGRDRKNRGVWVGDEKIAALGVRITGGVTMHGFALNVRTNLDDYRWIVPCGIRDKGVTSLSRLVPDVSTDRVKERVVKRFSEVFEYEDVRTMEPAELERWAIEA